MLSRKLKLYNLPYSYVYICSLYEESNLFTKMGSWGWSLEFPLDWEIPYALTCIKKLNGKTTAQLNGIDHYDGDDACAFKVITSKALNMHCSHPGCDAFSS